MAAELTDEQIIATALSMGMWGVQGVRPNGETFITGMGDGVIKTVRSLLATQGAEPLGFAPAEHLEFLSQSPSAQVTMSPAATGYCTVPLYTAPPPTAEVEKDAARYGWLRKGLALNVEVPTSKKPVFYLMAPRPEKAWGTSLDAAIDAAIQSDQAQAGKGE